MTASLPPPATSTRATDDNSVEQDRRPHLARQAATRRESRPRPEVWYIVEFAEKWSAFGGPPDDEVFVRFGIGRARFDELLADSLDQIARQLRRVRRSSPRPH